ncbi:MAG TPA: 30S ribosomal protein S12 methylthiotransferase RimO [Bacillota bacterium]|nr:30S ribosomal protein S12 methylthiotransferase RimO [Bacillota bacterium]
MKKTLGLVSLGCAKNRVDAEVMLGILKNKNYSIVSNPEAADVIIVNTCGFIDSAKEESINAILEQSKHKKTGRCQTLVVSGCLSERYNKELLKEIPEIDAVLGTGDYLEIASVLDKVESGSQLCSYGNINAEFSGVMPRLITTVKPSAYLKIAEGCDNRCTYCVIPSLRGDFRSKPIEDVLEEAEVLARDGIKELIIVAQDITRYGQDSNGQYDLTVLLKKMCRIPEIKWIRLLYAYPDRISKGLIDTIADEPKICKYLDIPIQHINQDILRSMNRSSDNESIKKLIKYIRKRIPDVVLRTSLIVGFPGETEEQFDELIQFVEQGNFNNMGIFTYSQEDGTKAASMEMQISDWVKKERQGKLLSIQKRISKRLNRKRVGQTCEVLVEGIESDGVYYGRSYGETPEADGLVYVSSEKPLQIGVFYKVRIVKAFEYDLMGEAE